MQASEEKASYQLRVGDWMQACFGETIAADQVERNDRFVEEALELAQSLGWTADRAHALVDYVFGRPAGEPEQEVGGVMVTLAALCNTAGLDMQHAAEVELSRIWTKVEAIRAKQAAKPTGSALPVAAASPAPTVEIIAGILMGSANAPEAAIYDVASRIHAAITKAEQARAP